jgi:hypothetical protein
VASRNADSTALAASPLLPTAANDLPSCELAKMQNDPSQIDPIHARAIVMEVGERLRLILGNEGRPSSSLQHLIDRLPELDEEPPPIAPE